MSAESTHTHVSSVLRSRPLCCRCDIQAKMSAVEIYHSMSDQHNISASPGPRDIHASPVRAPIPEQDAYAQGPLLLPDLPPSESRPPIMLSGDVMGASPMSHRASNEHVYDSLMDSMPAPGYRNLPGRSWDDGRGAGDDDEEEVLLAPSKGLTDALSHLSVAQPVSAKPPPSSQVWQTAAHQADL
jgi:hypothetical protein